MHKRSNCRDGFPWRGFTRIRPRVSHGLGCDASLMFTTVYSRGGRPLEDCLAWAYEYLPLERRKLQSGPV